MRSGTRRSDIYPTYSDLCRAERHAGVIDEGGGLVEVGATAGRDVYAGSTRSRVTTGAWCPYGNSFRVRRPDRGRPHGGRPPNARTRAAR